MRRPALATIGCCVLAVLAGCGSSGTRTVSVSDTQSTPAGAGSTTASTASSHTSPAGGTGPAAGASGSSGANGGTPASQGGPAFVAPSGGGSGLAGAEAVLQAHGFRALDPGDYRGAQTLRVLIGARQGSAGAHTQQAFFFVGGRFLGTDTSDPSAQIRVVSQTDTGVTLSYALYRPGDALCCASAGRATVTYQLDNGRLRPLEPIPSASPSAAQSRQ